MRQDLLDTLGWDEATLSDIRFAGYSYLKEGRYDTALTFFKTLSTVTETLYDLQTLGGLYLQTKDYLAALDHLEKALKEEPTHGLTLLNRAKALFGLGYKKQALLQAKTLQTNPDPRIASHATALVLVNS